LNAQLIKLTAQADVPPNNQAKEFACIDKMVCVANVNGTITAMDNVCLHRGGPLGQGVIEKGKVVCPCTAGFGIRGPAAAHNAEARLAVYPLKIEDGEVLIEI